MSGALTGEVNRNGRRLLAAKIIPKAARRALSIVAECCRDHNRIGPVPLDYLAGAMEGASERTASRALQALREVGLIEVVRRGGGRAHAGRPTIYRLTDVERWLAERGVPPEQHRAMAGQSVHDGDPIADDVDFTRHPDGGSIGSAGRFPADSPATSGDSISGNGDRIGYSPAISGRLTRHPGGEVPVVPGRTPERETPEPTTRPRPAPRPRTRPQAPGQMPLVAALPDLAPSGSLCGRADCRDPAPCRPCGQARAAAEHARVDAEHNRRAAAEERDRARVWAARRAAQERALAAAACPLQCRDGFLPGPRLCDHQDRVPRTGDDFPEWRELRARLPAGRPPPRRGVLRGRHRAHDAARAS